METIDKYLEFQLHLIINRFFLPCLLFLGTVGNIIIIVVLSRPRNCKYSTARFMLALAVSDLLTLWLVIPNRWIDSMYGFNIRQYSDQLCKIHMAVSYIMGQISVFFIVLLNIERLIAIMLPLKMKIYCSIRNANNAITAIPFIAISISSHMFYGISINENGKCSRNEELYNQWIWRIWQILNIVISIFVSFSILLVANVFNFTKLGGNYCRRLRRKYGHEVSRHVNKRKMLKIYFTLCLVTITFMSCCIPIGIYLLTYSGTQWDKGNSHEEAKIQLFFTVSSTCILINSVLNFFIYFLRGSKFKKEVKNIFCKKNGNRK